MAVDEAIFTGYLHGPILLSFSPMDLESIMKIPNSTHGKFAEKLKTMIGSLEEFGVKLEPIELA